MKLPRYTLTGPLRTERAIAKACGRFVAALSGELRIVAHFPQGDVVISQFEDIQERETPAKTS